MAATIGHSGEETVVSGDLVERRLGRSRVLFGAHGGKYPDGNSLLVEGDEERIVIDPALGLVARRGRLPPVDRVVHSHCHEDHVAGLHLFPDATCHFHEADLPGIRSLDAMMAIYGFEAPVAEPWRRALRERFHWTARPDARGFRDGEVFDLGGGVHVTALHAPGHTRGHCFLHVEPDDVLFVGDVDLSSFGPYYGDAWSDLEDFERTLERARRLRARLYVTFHHVGVLEPLAFRERLARYAEVIRRREARLLAFLAEPRSLDEIVAHRFVYRPQDAVPYADPVERRSMGQHLARLLRDGRVLEPEPGRYRRA
jgi:glyoxylase-like metal-dependent hydrolase (beta-lactamase superfamily II)